MLRRLSVRERAEILASTWEASVRQAFLDAIDDITSHIVLRRLIERLERRDVEGAIRVLNIDEGAFSPFAEALRQAFNAGGVDTIGAMPALKDSEGHRVVVRFDSRNPAAERWLSDHSSNLITRIVDDQKQAIRETLNEGLARGDNPTRSALSIAGRIDRVSGKRVGGIIGLTSPQAQFVANARRELSSSDPEALKHYLTRRRRDKRFDRTILKAIHGGKAIPPDMIERIVGRYSDGLLKLRTEQLALNETMAALAASKNEAWRQQIEAGKVRAEVVTKIWQHTPQEHPRVQHVMMNGKSVPFDQPFILPDGTAMDYPHDPKAPARHLLGCKCTFTVRVNYIEELARRHGLK